MELFIYGVLYAECNFHYGGVFSLTRWSFYFSVKQDGTFTYGVRIGRIYSRNVQLVFRLLDGIFPFAISISTATSFYLIARSHVRVVGSPSNVRRTSVLNRKKKKDIN